jgi:hypothetical protein
MSPSLKLCNRRDQSIAVIPRLANVREYPRANAHRREFLEEQLASVGDLDLAYLVGSPDARGGPALVRHLLEVGLRG